MKQLMIIGMLSLGFAATATPGTAPVKPATTLACTMTAYVAYNAGNTIYFSTAALRNWYLTAHPGSLNGGIAYNVPCNKVLQPANPGLETNF
ncbi:hypothetical protein DBR43_07215 [Pedobacter sp. KBW06]|uniref:hypothetical protein n=1 Tax=Pedobacter sp. KBW06 TaxID=2153359 RepID=UPI000F5AC390|nr:hypothetical protein [Pedobacter sp. KBW06]RQO75152.1 hypothetical protein DBR43_07215 [Pedobacter sp. KBW06]